MAHDLKRAKVAKAAEASLRRKAKRERREGWQQVQYEDRCNKSGKPTGVNALTAAGSTQPSPQASYAHRA